MSTQEQRNISYLVSSLLAAGLYTYFALSAGRGGDLTGTTISSFWGRIALLSIAVQVALSILFAILGSILYAVATREETLELADERDRLIELRANRIAYAVFGVGFLLSMLLLALGGRPLLMFHLIVFSLFGAALTGNVTQLYLYRRGF